MKKTAAKMITLSILATLVLGPATAHAQEEEPPPPSVEKESGPIAKANNFTVNPLGAVLGGLNLTYTRALGDTFSIGFLLQVTVPLLMPATGIGGGIELFLWPRRPNNGFFVGPVVGVSRTFPTDESKYVGATALTIGALLGWRWIWDSGLNLGLGGGIAYGVALGDSCPSGRSCTTIGDGVMPKLIFDIGYAF